MIAQQIAQAMEAEKGNPTLHPTLAALSFRFGGACQSSGGVRHPPSGAKNSHVASANSCTYYLRQVRICLKLGI